jgi:hypothetical protein
VTPLAVIKDFDVFLDRRLCVGPGCISLVVDQLVLQTSPKALHRGIVIAVSLSRHGRQHAKLFDQLAIIIGAVLAPSVRVMNQPYSRPLVAYCSPQGLRSQALRHARAHCIANQFAGEDVFDASEVKPALAGR